MHLATDVHPFSAMMWTAVCLLALALRNGVLNGPAGAVQGTELCDMCCTRLELSIWEREKKIAMLKLQSLP